MNLKIARIGCILAIVIASIACQPTKQNVQMNNETCPVSGKRVNGKDTYCHKGKEYNLCSEKCKRPLSENPEKYLSE